MRTAIRMAKQSKTRMGMYSIMLFEPREKSSMQKGNQQPKDWLRYTE
jgi:hypothetical protein